MKTCILSLREAHQVDLVGGKALSLGRMLEQGFTVPNGFVVTTTASTQWGSALEAEILEAYDALSTQHVAVRSSAVSEDGPGDAWAGQLDTSLNVSRDQLLNCIKKCQMSVGSDRAKAYAEHKNIQPTKVAVVVQEMVQSDVSGVAFSHHPVTQSSNHVVIEAGLGLGEAVVSGEITPDTYICHKSSGAIAEKYVAHQTKKLVRDPAGSNQWQQMDTDGHEQKLADHFISELSHLVKKLEHFHGFPVDVEWALVKDKLHILQSRPITTLPVVD